MTDLLVVVAFLLLAAGVVGSVLPSAPGALLSIAGVLTFWWHSGFTEPEPLVLGVLVAVGLFALVVDWLGGVLSAKVGGASTLTAVIAGAVGLVLLFFVGPLGVLVGVTATVFGVEFYRNRDPRASAKAAVVTTLGMLGSNGVQALLTATMLIAMVLVVT
jgi:uncharacterized protein YqgC (DUF456 family)